MTLDEDDKKFIKRIVYRCYWSLLIFILLIHAID